jgi:hypothetical protein
MTTGSGGGSAEGSRGPGGLERDSAELRSESADLDAMLHGLIERLQGIPGLQVAVKQHHRRVRRLIGDIPYINDLHRRSDRIDRVVVTVGAAKYWVESDGSSVTCGQDLVPVAEGHPSTHLPFADWSDALFADISRSNREALDSLTALRGLVEDEPS